MLYELFACYTIYFLRGWAACNTVISPELLLYSGVNKFTIQLLFIDKKVGNDTHQGVHTEFDLIGRPWPPEVGMNEC